MDFERGPVINSHIRVWRHRDDSKRGKFPQQQIAQWRTPLRLIEGNQQKIRFRLRYQGGYVLLVIRFSYHADPCLLGKCGQHQLAQEPRTVSHQNSDACVHVLLSEEEEESSGKKKEGTGWKGDGAGSTGKTQ